jgi:hypothetical protein
MNNFSLFSADRMTHLKIVVVALSCATLVASIGVAARISDTTGSQIEATAIKAAKPVTAAVGEARTVR